jgi:hypothetical protein
MTQASYSAACLCGAVRIDAYGEPKRVGLCHCLDCQKTTGSAFNPFVVFDRDKVRIRGDTGAAISSPQGRRHFCRNCGSFMFSEEVDGPEVELSLGTIDEPAGLTPTYEIWTIRRAPWLPALPGAAQHERDRTTGSRNADKPG